MEEKHKLFCHEVDLSYPASPITTKSKDSPWNDNEYSRFIQVKRKKDFVCIEKINGKPINILEGLELHTRVFNMTEQNQLLAFISQLQDQGRKKQLKGINFFFFSNIVLVINEHLLNIMSIVVEFSSYEIITQ